MKFMSRISVFGFAAVASAAPILLTNTSNQLLLIDSANPGVILSSVPITGLGNENILGIDIRPATGALYGLGSSSRLYTIDRTTGVATTVGAAGAFVLNGTSFGFDFNPVPDRIRVTSNANQNLRLNPNDGTLTMTDGTLNPGDPNVAGSSYTNSFPGTATTTLYAIDSVTDQLFVQTPPNDGTLSLVGNLNFNTSEFVGFDIQFPGNTAYASLTGTSGFSSLYRVDLATGAATLVGAIGGGNQTISALAVDTPEPAMFLLVGMGLLIVGAIRPTRRSTAV